MPASKTLTSRYRIPGELLKDFRRNGPSGVLFIETGRKLILGESVVVTVEFPSRRQSFRLQARVVTARRGSREPPLAAGVEVEFLSGQQHRIQMLLDCAEGKQIDFKDRFAKRVPGEVEVGYQSDAGFVREFTEDISEGGTFIRTQRKLPVGTELRCKLKPPGYLLGVKLMCRVAWVADQGSPRGMGLEFIFTSERQRKKICGIVQDLARKHQEVLERGVKAFKERDRSQSS
jgi:type IV pilus assembly protein PilZ